MEKSTSSTQEHSSGVVKVTRNFFEVLCKYFFYLEVLHIFKESFKEIKRFSEQRLVLKVLRSSSSKVHGLR